MDTLAQMRIFCQTVDSGSLTAAARALGLTLPMVSRELARLERGVGQALLVRTTRSMALTEAGERYHARAADILERLTELDADMQDLAAEPAGELRVSVSEVLGYLRLTPLLRGFQESHPRIRLSVSYTDRNVDLVSERVDLAIRLGPLPDSGLRATRLFDSRGVLCAAPGYLAAFGTPGTLDDLVRHRLLGFLDGAAVLPWYFRESGQIRRVPVAATLCVDQALSYIALAKAGCGIALVFDWMIEAELAAGSLIPLLPDRPASYTAAGTETVYAVRPAARHEPAKVRQFIAYLSANLSPHSTLTA